MPSAGAARREHAPTQLVRCSPPSATTDRCRARSARSRSNAVRRSRAPARRTRSPSFIPLSRGIPRRAKALPVGCAKLFRRLWLLGPTALPFELLRVQGLEPLITVCILRAFVVPNPDDPREAQRESARVVGAPLDLVVRDLDDDLRSDMEPPPLLRRRERAESFRHRFELRVGQALERLADHLERARRLVPHREPVVRQPSLSPAGPPFRRDDRHVEVVCRLDLEPFLPALSDRIRRLEVLCHEPF